ncbi:MAG: poly-beta-1,6-N-acetyl-D-glucosamine synthase [Sulfuricurvum sp.]
MTFHVFWHSVWHLILGYIFYYPLFMSTLWIFGAIFFYFKNEKRYLKDKIPTLRPKERWEGASILIPCYNEGPNVRETIHHALNVDYPEFEVIAINDGSKDDTLEILLELARENPKLKVVNLAENQGKALGLQAGALVAKYEYLICIDGDALIDPYCVHWMVKHFVRYPEVAAVTGNPRIRNRTSLLGKIQVGEFSSIVGMIKRAQRSFGRLFTVSGVITGFRKSAVHEIGYWSPDMLTEDIDVTWKLQRNGWDVRFEPRALVWILMPETLKGLWKQRLRWAMGGAQVMLKNVKILFHPLQTHLWGLMIELLMSLVWSYSMVLVFAVWLLDTVFNLPLLTLSDSPVLPNESSVILIGACLIQFWISKWLDGHYDQGLGKNYFWMIWYPFAFWFLNLFTSVAALPKVIFAKQKRARWVSPDRGVHQQLPKKKSVSSAGDTPKE